MKFQRLTTVVTMTAFVSALSTPAVAQRRRHPAHPAHPASSAPPPAQASASPAPADTSVAEARTEYGAGQQAVTANQPDEAVRHFQRAYDLHPNPVVLLAIGQAQQQGGHVADALATLQRYLHDRADAPDRAAVEQRIADLQRTPATLHVTSSPTGGHIFVDDHDTGAVTPADVPAQSGHHTVRIELAGFAPNGTELDSTPGGHQDVNGTLEASAPIIADNTITPSTTSTTATTGPTADEPRTSPVVWVATAVFAGGIIAGSVFGFMALSDHTDYIATPTEDIRDRGQQNAVLSDVFFGVAVLAAAVGVVVWFAGDHEPSAASPASPAPVPIATRRRNTHGIHFNPASMSVTF